MSMQQVPTLQHIDIQYHDSKTQADALIAQLFRGHKENDFRLRQENRLLKVELQKLRDKYEPKKDEKPKKGVK